MKKLECANDGHSASMCDKTLPDGGVLWYIGCYYCGQIGPRRDTQDKARKAWNKQQCAIRRTEPPVGLHCNCTLELKQLEPCSNCGEAEILFEDFGWGFWRVYCANENCSEEVLSRSKKLTRKIWNKQQRQVKPREWKYEVTKAISFLYRTVGRQMWLDCLEDKDVIEIRDHIMPVFQKHLEMRKLTTQPSADLQKVRNDNLQLKITIEQLRERNAQLESERDQPAVDVVQVLLENEQLRLAHLQEQSKKLQHEIRISQLELNVADRESCIDKLITENEQLRQPRSQAVEQLSQAVEFSEQAAEIVLQVVGEIGKRE